MGSAGQRLALDETVPGTSIGGLLATNTSGPRRVATGTARDLLIGITVVRADGVVAKAGGRVVKNVAGYDLGKLMIGSLGTLAVIVDATFRLHPAAGRAELGQRAGRRPGRGAATRRSPCCTRRPCPPRSRSTGPPTAPAPCSVLLEGREEGVAGRAATVRAPARRDVDRVGGRGARGRRDVPLGRRGRRRRPRDRAQADLRALRAGRRAAAATEAGAHLRGSAGAGVAYAALPAGTPVDDGGRGARPAAPRLHRGTAAAPSWSTRRPTSRPAVDVWGPVPALDLMRRVKDQFDPDHRLAPGRFVGGI